MTRNSNPASLLEHPLFWNSRVKPVVRCATTCGATICEFNCLYLHIKLNFVKYFAPSSTFLLEEKLTSLHDRLFDIHIRPNWIYGVPFTFLSGPVRHSSGIVPIATSWHFGISIRAILAEAPGPMNETRLYRRQIKRSRPGGRARVGN